MNYKAWREKCEKANDGKELAVGDEVWDGDKGRGIVVKIIPNNPENPIEEHGAIYVWQMDRLEHGADNCEHYAFTNWNWHLMIMSK